MLSHRGHAVANGLPVLSCNRVGHEPSPLGASRHPILGHEPRARPAGRVPRRSRQRRSRELLVADVDLARSEHVRRIWPFLRDRRIDAYRDLLKRFRD